MDSITIRSARISDIPQITEIYNHYILNTLISFDTKPMTPGDYRKWFDKYALAGPYRLFVAEENGKILGHAGSRQYRDHPAFDETVEFGIYLIDVARGKGLGRALYARVFEAIVDEKIHLVVAGIALPNPASVALHKSFGFEEVGVFREYAKKNGHYLSSLWMQKSMT